MTARHGRPVRLDARAALAPGLALLLLAAPACASAPPAGNPLDGVPTPVSLRPSSAATAATTPTPLPLTGLPASSRKQAARPIVAVAVETGTGSPSASGVGDADVVYVTFPSPSRQRALALFHSKDSDRVGPVAKTRPVDGKLLRALGAVLEHSGGTSGFVEQVRLAGLPSWSALVHESSFTRDAETGALYGATAPAREASGASSARPGLLAFRDSDDAPQAEVGSVTVEIPGQPRTELTFDRDTQTWRGAVGGFSLRATNVVIQEVSYAELVLPKTGGRTEGNPLPDGKGPATLLAGADVDADGSWNRPGARTSTKYVHHDGVPARLVPGTTWILLVPSGTDIRTP